MNFLAHALLADDKPNLIVGGVIGDWIKGPLPGALPADLAKGVALHRAIDNFAESNPSFRQSRARVSSTRRRYAGVLVDIFYDHLLARQWHEFHPQPLHQYCESINKLITARIEELPQSAQPALSMMVKENWLSSYAQIENIADVLVRMSRRARQPNPLAHGEQEFLRDKAGFECDFYVWLEDAKSFSRKWIEDL